MTIKYSKEWDDYDEKIIHDMSPPCLCWLCLWRKYYEQVKRKRERGRIYELLTFFIWDLIFEVKDEYLKRMGIKKRIKYKGKLAWDESLDPEVTKIKYRDIPFKREAKKILDQIPFEHYLDSKKYIKYYFDRDVRKHRFDNPRFRELRKKLERDIVWDWQLKQSGFQKRQKQLEQNYEAWSLAVKVAQYIYERPNQKIAQRELSKRFQTHRGKTLKKEDFKAIWDILRGMKIEIEERAGYRNKQTFYRWTKKSKLDKFKKPR